MGRAAATVVKQDGGANDLIARLKADKAFAAADIEGAIDSAALVGRSREQVDEFIGEVVAPIRERYNEVTSAEVRV